MQRPRHSREIFSRPWPQGHSRDGATISTRPLRQRVRHARSGNTRQAGESRLSMLHAVSFRQPQAHLALRRQIHTQNGAALQCHHSVERQLPGLVVGKSELEAIGRDEVAFIVFYSYQKKNLKSTKILYTFFQSKSPSIFMGWRSISDSRRSVRKEWTINRRIFSKQKSLILFHLI